MSFELDAMQRLLLWRLAVSEEGEFLKDIKTSLSAAKRKALVREGYVDERPRKHPKSGRKATFLILEDKGWSWCQEHLADEIKTRSLEPRIILERLLKLMSSYLGAQSQTNSFGQFVLQARQNQSPSHEMGTNSLEDKIRETCVRLGHGQRNVRIRLTDLRRQLNYSRDTLDEKLLEMEQRGELSLYPLDNPQEITSADREDALKTRTGNERHIIYFEGNS